MRIGRSILAVLGGAIAAGLVISATEMIAHDALTGEAVFGATILGYGLGAAAGTAAATLVADSRTAVIVPVILAGLAAVNLFSFAHPWWFAPAAIAALVLGWLLGSRLSRRPLKPALQGGGIER